MPSTTPDLLPAATEALAHRLMEALGRDLLGEPLQARGWTFGWDRARTRLGACRPRQKRITLSAPLASRLTAEVMEDTIRHEIAHAVDVERRGKTNHDATWKALAVACGATPERCFSGGVGLDPDAPYVATCPGCGAASGVFREPLRPRRCRSCAAVRRPSFLRVVRRDGRVIWPGGESAGRFGGRSGFVATCRSCGETTRRARRPARPLACGACCSRHARGAFDERFRLRFKRPKA